MELNREQIVKVLESHKKRRCYDCPLGKEDIQQLNAPCSIMVAELALDLYCELTEEIEEKDETIAGLIGTIKDAYGFAVRKMQERFNQVFGGMDATNALLRRTFDRVAKEVLGENK